MTFSGLTVNSTFALVKDFPTYHDFCGSGFFVASDGYFLTAAHIFEKDPRVPLYIATDPEHPGRLVPFKRIATSPLEDVSLCKAEVNNDRFLVIASELPQVGSGLFALGYAGRQNDIIQISEVSCSCLGRITELRIPSIPPFSAKAFPAIVSYPSLRAGYSGGPLLDSNGRVVGLHSNMNRDANLLEMFGKTTPLAVSVSSVVLDGAMTHIR